MTKIVAGVLERNGVPGAVAGLVIGGKDVGEAVVESQDVDLGKYVGILRELCPDAAFPVSFTGSESVGRQVGKVVQSRFGKVLLELGGNNGTSFH